MPEITASDGVRLNYLESGDPNGRAVLLVAGFKAPATSWKRQLHALHGAGCRVIALDRRGHGASEIGPDGAHTMDRHGADIGDAIATLGLDDATVVGQSMGGNSIWALLAAGRATGLRDLVIVDQTPKMLNSDDWAYGFYDYDASNADTHFATGIPDPGRHSVAAKGPVRIARLLRAMDRTAGRPGFTYAELALLHDQCGARLAAGDRGDAGARAFRRGTGERSLAVRARGSGGIPQRTRGIDGDREGRSCDQHRAAEGVQCRTPAVARALAR